MAGGKIMAVSSGGGHWVQLMRLKPAFDDLNVFYVTLDRTAAIDVPGRRFYTIREASRKQKAGFFIAGFQLLTILIRERPSVVITTGSAPALIAVILARYLLRAKTIWIDSIANTERMSGSGQQAGKFADIWLTQWAHLAEAQNDNVRHPEHWGAVL
ncbi:MAG: UDP-N-acetylglucosamine--LPS N-acetylglucosamine transferase [Paracoccaceae bacterium]